MAVIKTTRILHAIPTALKGSREAAIADGWHAAARGVSWLAAAEGIKHGRMIADLPRVKGGLSGVYQARPSELGSQH